MSPLRHLFLFLSTASLLTCVCYVLLPLEQHTGHSVNHNDNPKRSFFSIRHPSSLFLPSASISLTEENATSFPARPAAFGPQLPTHGLSGQVWVGNGFGDDTFQRRGILTTSEGELGCSDIPGWDDARWLADPVPASVKISRWRGTSGLIASSVHQHEDAPQLVLAHDDGTDDRLYSTTSRTAVSNRNLQTIDTGVNIQHPDIQSLQESAEITGKVVLLSRGGCGFLEKVKWAQRRGAAAVIIGDNSRGGALIRMYAKGDTSNITIPSLFTSHTTAHLLSSLIPTEKPCGPLASSSSWDWLSRSRKVPPLDSIGHSTHSPKTTESKPPNAGTSAWSSKPSKSSQHAPGRYAFDFNNHLEQGHPSWLRAAWSMLKPHDGNIKHSLTDLPTGLRDGDVEDDQDGSDVSPISGHAYRKTQGDLSTRELVPHAFGRPPATLFPSTKAKKHSDQGSQTRHSIIIPRSGVYRSEFEELSARDPDSSTIVEEISTINVGDNTKQKHSGKGQLAYGENNEIIGARTKDASCRGITSTSSAHGQPLIAQYHVGLWVTMTPSDLDASPFLHTLFVLVVSPLMTLAIVYSMLLLRSRIRRRSWRAPKSVVERLPVRIYRALSIHPTSPSPSSETEPSRSNQCTSSTPLLQTSAPINTSQRPRPRSVVEASGSVSTSNRYGSLEPSPTEHEKNNAGLNEWRRRYGGKQVECVVCLEEYVDGVSRVMSLPCGHEFHVDCM